MESIHPQTVLRHIVEVRRLRDGMTVIARLRPSLIVGHHQYHVGLVGHKRHERRHSNKKDEC